MVYPISLRYNTVTSPERFSLDNPADVMGEVRKIILCLYKKFEFNQFEQVFSDILKLFNGNYPGYRRCNT